MAAVPAAAAHAVTPDASAADAVGRLATGVAHDLNNMLAVIMQSASVLEDEVEDASGAGAGLRRIQKAAESAAALSRRLSVFSRDEPVLPQTIDAGAQLLTAADLLSSVVSKGVDLSIRLPGEPLPVRIDPVLLDNALLNLVLNARDAMTGAGTIVIAAERVSLDAEEAAAHAYVSAGDYVRVTVSDDGPGMPAEVAARVFEPYFTTKPAGLGSGVGLATVYGVVKQAGGSIELDTAVGEGTTFTIYLPEVAHVDLGERVVNERTLGAGERTVLVVEGSPAVNASVREVLRRAGFDVRSATDAAGGLAELEADPTIGLLLADLDLPDVSGSQLAATAQRQLPALRVLFMSAYPAAVLRTRFRKRPLGPVIAKPFHASELVRAVDSAFGDDGARAGSATA